MLSSITLQNFKPIRGLTEIEFGDVTILAGLNSSGKSSVLQAILMLSQTFGHSNYDRALVPNGNQVQLGLLSQVKNEKAQTTEAVTIGFRLTTDRPDKLLHGSSRTQVSRLSVLADFQPTELDTGILRSEVGSTLISLRMEMELAYRRTISLSAAPITTKEIESFTQGINNQDSQRWRFEEGNFYQATISSTTPRLTTGEERKSTTTAVAKMRHFMPDRLIAREPLRLEWQRFYILNELIKIALDHHMSPTEAYFRDNAHTLPFNVLELINRAYEYVEGQFPKTDAALLAEGKESSLAGFLVWLRRILPTLRRRIPDLDRFRSNLNKKIKRDFERWLKTSSVFELVALQSLESEIIEETVREATNFFFGKIRYLGPLRADPKALQSFSPSSEIDDVGSSGQYAAAVYDANRSRRITWWNPTNGREDISTLEFALNSWIQHLGVAYQVHTSEARESGVAWRVLHRPGAQDRPLSAVGVGVSQVVPILVAGLLAPHGSLLILEQPELHLHMRAQARLGDFFVGLSRTGKRCVIETHSDCLVNQMRLYIVNRGSAVDLPQVQILFAGQDLEGNSSFTPVQISPNGNILNWPEGFFDQAIRQEEAITHASLRNRLGK